MSILHSSARPNGAFRRSREVVARSIIGCAARPSSASRYKLDHCYVNGLVRRALLRTSCLGLIYFEKKAARATSKKLRRVKFVEVKLVDGLNICNLEQIFYNYLVARCVSVPRCASSNASRSEIARSAT